MKKKNGFIAISLIYSFFLCFIMIMMGLLANYTHSKLILDKINTPLEFKKQTEDNTCPDGNCEEDGEYNYCKDTCKPLNPPADFQKLLSELFYDSSYYGSLSRLETKDNDGTSYVVFEKNPDNYVKFGQIDGKDLIWRILRINGDGSIRIMLDSSIGHTVSAPRSVELNLPFVQSPLFISPYKPCPEDDDDYDYDDASMSSRCGLGIKQDYDACKDDQSELCYIYPNKAEGETYFCNDKGNLHSYSANFKLSPILGKLIGWYYTFLEYNEDLECKIVFSTFYSDNSISAKITTRDKFEYNFFSPYKKIYNNLDSRYKNIITDDERKEVESQMGTEQSLDLQCSNCHIYKSKIGLITAEEVKILKYNWLNNGKEILDDHLEDYYFTMSPAYCDIGRNNIYKTIRGHCSLLSVNPKNDNQLLFTMGEHTDGNDVYPVISLDKNITITGGKGTKDNPYTLE